MQMVGGTARRDTADEAIAPFPENALAALADRAWLPRRNA